MNACTSMARATFPMSGRARVYGTMTTRSTLGMTLDGLGFARHEFTGKVARDAIEGSVRVSMRSEANKALEETFVLPWRARRSGDADYFAPTGLDIL